MYVCVHCKCACSSLCMCVGRGYPAVYRQRAVQSRLEGCHREASKESRNHAKHFFLVIGKSSHSYMHFMLCTACHCFLLPYTTQDCHDSTLVATCICHSCCSSVNHHFWTNIQCQQLLDNQWSTNMVDNRI